MKVFSALTTALVSAAAVSHLQSKSSPHLALIGEANPSLSRAGAAVDSRDLRNKSSGSYRHTGNGGDISPLAAKIIFGTIVTVLGVCGIAAGVQCIKDYCAKRAITNSPTEETNPQRHQQTPAPANTGLQAA